MAERLPQSPTPEERTVVLPPEEATGGLTPVPTAPAPEPQGLDLGTPEEIEALLAVALDPENLKNHPNGVAIQRLATQINMIMKDNRIPPQEKQRLLEELIPQLVALLEGE